MLTRLVIENFKCIEDAQELNFSKYNIIYGASGTGKSTIVHAIKLIMKTYLLDPPLREPDYSVSSIEEMLPNRDVDKRIKVALEGKLKIPFINQDIKFDISLTLSVSDGTLTTGIEVESTKIPQGEMLQAMFSYVVKEHTIGKYSIKFEAHYLTHSIYNVRVVYPRVTVFDKELFIILYQEIFPKILENNIHIISGFRTGVEYSFKPMIENDYMKIVRKMFVNPHVKYNVSEDLSKVLNDKVLLDLRKLEKLDEYVLEDVVKELPVSCLGTSFINLLYLFTELESLNNGGTLIVDDFDSYIDDTIIERVCDTLIERCEKKNIQLILLVRSKFMRDLIVKRFRENNINVKVFSCEKSGGRCRVCETIYH